MIKQLLFATLIIFTPALQADVQRSIAVSGSSSVALVPDEARLSFNVTELNQTAAQALTTVNRRINKLLTQLTAQGILEQDITATSQRVAPQYRWDATRQVRLFEGFEVGRDVTVTIRDLTLLGPLMESLVKIGVTRLSPPDLVSSQRKTTEHQGLALAFSDAKIQAELLANAAGLTLAGARTIETHSAQNASPRPMMRMEAAADDGAGRYLAGQLQITTKISVVFDAQ
ncbi:SIMPL domain-containing protein [Flavobacteriaceae bacterium]|nr:SIMPL domain-containing protein [Flavobacteriaceae bacterium]